MNRIPSQSQKTVAMSLDADLSNLNFRGGFSPFSIHCIYSKLYCRDPCFINSDNARKNVVRIIATDVQKLLRSCDPTLLVQGSEHFWHPSRAHLCHVQMIMQNVTDSFLANAYGFSYLPQLDSPIFQNKFFNFSIFSSVTAVFGRPDLGSSSSDSLPCLNSRLQRFMVANGGPGSP